MSHHESFGYGVTTGFALVAVMMIVLPRRYVENFDRATFRCVWVTASLRAALGRLFGRAEAHGAIEYVRARVDSAIARRHDPSAERAARTLGALILACCAVMAMWPAAVVSGVAVAAGGLAIFILRLEARTPSGRIGRAAALQPRAALDGALMSAIAVAAVLLLTALAIAAAGEQIPGRVDLIVAAIFGSAILALALRLARRPAAISGDDVAVDAYVDEHLRVTRVAYLLVLALFPIAVAMVRGSEYGGDGVVLRDAYEIGFAAVMAAWLAAAMRGPKVAGT